MSRRGPSTVRWALVAALVLARSNPARACDSQTKIFGLPVWATDPNEGSTWGAMPVVLSVCPDHGTQWILAPSITWNSIIRYTGTLRWYQYPSRDTSLFALASASTRTNYRLVGGLLHIPTAAGAWTDEITVRIERNIFAQFFGIGPDTPESAESSYTLGRALVFARRGINVGGHVNVGALASIERDTVGDTGVAGLPLTPDEFPDVPGIHGASLLTEGLDVRFDSRDGGDFADAGLRIDLWGAVVEGLSNSPSFLRAGSQINAIWPELDWLGGAARLSTSVVGSADVPFYQQSELGGAFLLRGYDDGRFIDRDAWTLEFEQRLRVLRTHFFGVVADWRVDPFVTTGQVFDALSEALSNPKFAAGVGLRAFVRPSVVGRVDVALGSEGLKVYVEIGYPY